jgi:hypothetical protein
MIALHNPVRTLEYVEMMLMASRVNVWLGIRGIIVRSILMNVLVILVDNMERKYFVINFRNTSNAITNVINIDKNITRL